MEDEKKEEPKGLGSCFSVLAGATRLALSGEPWKPGDGERVIKAAGGQPVEKDETVK